MNREIEQETDELLDRPNFCKIAICPNCGRTLGVCVWDEHTGKEMKREYGKLAQEGYNIIGVSLRDARNQNLFHSEDCPRNKKNYLKRK